MTLVLVFVLGLIVLVVFVANRRVKTAPPRSVVKSLKEKGQTIRGQEPFTDFDRLLNEIEEIRRVGSLQLQRVRDLGRLLDQIYPSRITRLQQTQIEITATEALIGKHVSWQTRVSDVGERASFFLLESMNKGGVWVSLVEHSPFFVVECQTLRADAIHLQPKQSGIASGRIAKVKIQWPSLLLMLVDGTVSPTSETPPALPGRAEVLRTEGILLGQEQPTYTGYSSGEPSYQTAPLTAYSAALRERAEELFNRVTQRIGHRAKRYKGSFSIFANTSSETAAKIVIYQRGLGRENGLWPILADGVYVLVRCNGAAGRAIWGGQMLRSSTYHQQLDSRNTLGIAPKHDERFAFFRLSDDDRTQDVAELLVACATA